MVSGFLYGASMPLRALRIVLRSPALMGWAALPILITLGLYAFGFQAAQTWAQDMIRVQLVHLGVNPEGWAASGILLLTSLILLLVGAVTFSVVATVLASPFNDFLAEAAEPRCDPPLPSAGNPTLGMRLRLIRIDLVKSGIALVGLLFSVLISWVPVVNLLGFALAFTLVTFQYVSYAQTRRGLASRDGFRFIGRNLFASIGFGAVFTALFAIPFVSCLALPLAVVGGTQLVARDRQKMLA
jgi:CysZ protein